MVPRQIDASSHLAKPPLFLYEACGRGSARTPSPLPLFGIINKRSHLAKPPTAVTGQLFHFYLLALPLFGIINKRSHLVKPPLLLNEP